MDATPFFCLYYPGEINTAAFAMKHGGVCDETRRRFDSNAAANLMKRRGVFQKCRGVLPGTPLRLSGSGRFPSKIILPDQRSSSGLQILMPIAGGFGDSPEQE